MEPGGAVPPVAGGSTGSCRGVVVAVEQHRGTDPDDDQDESDRADDQGYPAAATLLLRWLRLPRCTGLTGTARLGSGLRRVGRAGSTRLRRVAARSRRAGVSRRGETGLAVRRLPVWRLALGRLALGRLALGWLALGRLALGRHPGRPGCRGGIVLSRLRSAGWVGCAHSSLLTR